MTGPRGGGAPASGDGAVSEPSRLKGPDLRMRLETAEWLVNVARETAADNLEGGPFTRALVVLWGPDGPVAYWHGRLSAREVEGGTMRAIRERTQPEGLRPSDFAASREAHAQKEAAAKPYECRRFGGCGKRFPTERGRDAHEAAAERARAAQAGEEAEYPLHRTGCWIPQGGSHCVCGLWPVDRRRASGDWVHDNLRYAAARTEEAPKLAVVGNEAG